MAVTAAAGGTGHLAVQLAAAAGAHVVAVVGGPHKAGLVSELGAATVIDYTQEPVSMGAGAWVWVWGLGRGCGCGGRCMPRMGRGNGLLLGSVGGGSGT